MRALEAFGGNLATLREDERIIFHPYNERDDPYFNLIIPKKFRLDSFDIVIMAQALEMGTLITEDEEILGVRVQEAFVNDPILRQIRIKRWKEMLL